MANRTHTAFWLATSIVLLAGCAAVRPATGAAAVTVSVDKDGHLETRNGIPIADADLPGFVKEVGGQSVSLVPISSGNEIPTFATLMAAQQKLKAAGLSRVGIEGVSGG